MLRLQAIHQPYMRHHCTRRVLCITILCLTPALQIAGHKTGFGSPSWLQTHPAADHTAPPIAQLLAAGASVVGKTHMDELAYSLNGENAHYGTPVNVAAPGRVPGGSSSGSAVSPGNLQTSASLFMPLLQHSKSLLCCNGGSVLISKCESASWLGSACTSER